MDPPDEEAYRSFVAARYTALLRTAYLIAGGDAATAEDLLQTALAKTCLAWRRIDPQAAEAYARKVLVNTATSWWRRRWNGERPTEILSERATVDQLGAVDERAELWPLVRALPPRQRAVLVLRYYEDRTEAEIADLLGISPGTVKSQASRALAALRVRLGSESGAPSLRVATAGGEQA